MSEIETNDIYRASYLLCCGGEVAECFTGRRGRVSLIVTGPELDKEDTRYRMGKALVNPRELKDMLNYLRDEYIRPLTQQSPSTRQTDKTGDRQCRSASSRSRRARA